MLGRVVRCVRDNGVSDGGFSACGYLYIVFSFVYRDVSVVCVILFSFCGKV